MKFFEKVSFEDESSINYSFQLETGKKRHEKILIIEFNGKYHYGSQGRKDAIFILGIIYLAIAFWEPRSIIIDFSNLAYTWGNEMIEIILNPLYYKSSAIVIGSDCKEGFSTLKFGKKTNEDNSESSEYFNTIDEALSYLYTLDNESSLISPPYFSK